MTRGRHTQVGRALKQLGVDGMRKAGRRRGCVTRMTFAPRSGHGNQGKGDAS